MDLRKERPDDFEAILARLEQAGTSLFQTGLEDDANYGSCVSWTRMLLIWDGFLGPRCDL